MTTPLKVFVAMPGTTLGEHATWTDPEEIKEHFYEPLARKLGERLGREVELVIEKDKDTLGVIYSSMYGEAMTARSTSPTSPAPIPTCTWNSACGGRCATTSPCRCARTSSTTRGSTSW